MKSFKAASYCLSMCVAIFTAPVIARPPETLTELWALSAEAVVVGTIPDFQEKMKRVAAGDKSMIKEIETAKGRFTSGFMEVEIEFARTTRGFDVKPKTLKIGFPIWVAGGNGGVLPHLKGAYEKDSVFFLMPREEGLTFECVAVASQKEFEDLNRFVEEFNPEADFPRFPQKKLE